jgi:hypothetical protein
LCQVWTVSGFLEVEIEAIWLIRLAAAALRQRTRNVRLLGSGRLKNTAALIGGRYIYASVLRNTLRVAGRHMWPQNMGRDSEERDYMLSRSCDMIGGRSSLIQVLISVMFACGLLCSGTPGYVSKVVIHSDPVQKLVSLM